jgi:hypothetical protein
MLGDVVNMSRQGNPDAPKLAEELRLYIDSVRIYNFKKIIIENVKRVDVRQNAIFIESAEFLNKEMFE